jgi:hypothetical protein
VRGVVYALCSARPDNFRFCGTLSVDELLDSVEEVDILLVQAMSTTKMNKN